jgi:cytochrome c oxidase assembly protein subunit 11
MENVSQTGRNSGQTVSDSSGKKHGRVVLPLVLLVAGMTGLAFASAPLYRLFCAATGYGGTTQRVAAFSGDVREESITIRFDANTSSALKWDFRPEQREITLKIGENSLAFYRAVNRGNTPLTGSATFNVTPEIAGSYFNKVECFCFTEQTLAPGQAADFPVSFFVDPAILSDPDAKNLKEITLSYTFFRVNKDGDKASSPAKGAASRSMEKSGSSG